MCDATTHSIAGALSGMELLPSNSVCRFIGYSPIRYPYSMSRKVPVNQCFIDFMSDCRRLGGTTNLPSLSKSGLDHNSRLHYHSIYRSEMVAYREVWSAGHDSSLSLLRESASSTSAIDIGHVSKVLEVSGFKFLNLPHLDYRGLNLDCVRINPDSSPGLYTKNFFGPARKFSVNSTKGIAEDLLRLLVERPIGNFTLWEMLGREKDIKVPIPSGGEDLATRLVLNMEEPLMILATHFLQPINDALSADVHNSIMIGKTLNYEIGEEFHDCPEGFDLAIELDWPHFDLHVDKEEMLLAVSLLRMCYPCSTKKGMYYHPKVYSTTKPWDGETPLSSDALSDLHDRAFCFIAHMCVFKNICLPGGLVYEVQNGLPSGLPGTSLLGTLVNLIRWCVIGFELFGENYGECMRIKVQGDDSLILMKSVPNAKHRIIQAIKDRLHKTIDDLVIYPNFPTDDPDLVPTFLKRKYIQGIGPVWDEKKVIRKLIYQTKDRSDFLLQLEIAKNYVMAAPYNPIFNQFLLSYILFAREYYGAVLPDDFVVEEFEVAEAIGFSHDYMHVDFSSNTTPIGELMHRSDTVSDPIPPTKPSDIAEAASLAILYTNESIYTDFVRVLKTKYKVIYGAPNGPP